MNEKGNKIETLYGIGLEVARWIRGDKILKEFRDQCKYFVDEYDTYLRTRELSNFDETSKQMFDLWELLKIPDLAELAGEDLAVAKIKPIDKDGNEICFHSLRNSYISFLANSQIPAKVVQKPARHSDPRLIFNTYARTLREAEQKAVTFLPNFGNFVLSTCLDSNRKK